MASVSGKEHRAMEAAAHGVSNLGIPKKVGAEFARADKGKTFDQATLAPNAAVAAGAIRLPKKAATDAAPAKKLAAGAIFRAQDGSILLLKRGGVEGKDNFVGHWALPGGGADPGETADQCARREAFEEMGGNDESMREQIETGKRKVLSETDTPNGMRFTTFLHDVFQKFEPQLNGEHTEWTWAKPGALPSPMHPQVAKQLAQLAHDEVVEPGAQDAGPPPNDRSIFAYMEPPPNAAPLVVEQHAQCIVCRMMVPKDAMPAEGKHKKNCDLCVIVGSQEAINAGKNRGSCDEFVNWPTPDGMPDPAVVAEHAKKLAEGALGSSTKEAIGYVERAVRCENCFFGGKKCGWYDQLSEKLKQFFKETRGIKPKGCCNSQTPAQAMAADSAFLIAMDRDLEREKTRDGRLIVKRALITKANICPYRGAEIPGWQALGLDPDRVYNLLRDADEIRKGADTLNGVQLLIKHTPVSAKEPHQDKTVGSLGTDAEFDGDGLYNSLFVNVQEAIDGIESGKQRQLSAGYHYKPDMTPGIFGGKHHDGVMRDIVFNHVALVEDGRVGPDAAA